MTTEIAPTSSGSPALSETATYEIARRKHPWRLVAAVVVLVVLGLLAYGVANAKGLHWSVTGHYLFTRVVFYGFLRTLELTAAAMALGLCLGVIFGIMRLSHNPVLSGVAWFYVWVFRGTPIIVQLFMWFNLALIFPHVDLFGLVHLTTVKVMSPFLAALLGFGINEGAYMSEIIRGGLMSVPPGQTEAAMSLGASRGWTMRRVVLPQALRVILPTIGNETLGMLKYTSLAAFISFNELFGTVETIYYSNSQVMELLIVAAIWYLFASSVLSVGQYYLERRVGRGFQRGGRKQTLLEQAVIMGWARFRRQPSAWGGTS
ncbi:MAG: amino acid ABC transporter permease [Actinomycetota bacterium]|nr:amino acid ABC transporter permease [Actinomycetota bacterium]